MTRGRGRRPRVGGPQRQVRKVGLSHFQEAKLTRKAVIALATADTDFGHVRADKAKAEAKDIANEEGKPVTLRDPVTDEVITTVMSTK